MASNPSAMFAILNAAADDEGSTPPSGPNGSHPNSFGRNGLSVWDRMPLAIQPVTAAQRTAIITSLAGATVTVKADVLAAIATAATAAGTSQAQVYSLISNGSAATMG